VSKQLLDRIGTAMLALALSVIVWVNATYQTDRPSEDFYSGQIPVQVLGKPDDLAVMNGSAETVRVKIRAFASSWETLTVDDFVATVDWSELTTGVHVVPITVVVSDPTVTILSVHPQAMNVRVERLATSLRPVEISLVGAAEVPLGYRASDAAANPDEVSVSGPASEIDRVVSVVGEVSIAGQRADIDRVVLLEPIDSDGKLVDSVDVSPVSVRVQVLVEKREDYREVAVRIRTAGQPARGYFVSSVNVLPSTVTLVGPPATIEELGSLVEAREELDVTGANRMVAARMELDLPEGVSVMGAPPGAPYEVLVTVGIDAVTGGTTVELPLRAQRLQEGLQVSQFVPVIDVILTGPSVLLDELQTDRLSAVLDLGGLGPGTHQVRPTVNINTDGAPDLANLQVKDVLPQYVEVTITEIATPEPTPTLGPTPRP
jgi:YbbR domain-containing protein